MMESSYYLSDLCLEPVCAPYNSSGIVGGNLNNNNNNNSSDPYFYGQSFSTFPFYAPTDRRRPSFSFFNSSTSLLPNIDSFTSDYLHQRPSFSFPNTSSAAALPESSFLETIISPPHMSHLPHPPPLVQRAKAVPQAPLSLPPQLTAPPTLPLPTQLPVATQNNHSNNYDNHNNHNNKKPKTPKAPKPHKTPKSSKKEQKKAEKELNQPRANNNNGQAELPPIDAGSPQPNGENGRRPLLLKTDKKRVIWTKKLHALFLKALEELGHDAMPRTIWSYMEIPGLTRENVASHLQKYKIKLRRERALEEREEGILAEC